MTVSELIEKLKQFDGDRHIFIWNRFQPLTHTQLTDVHEFTQKDINVLLYKNDNEYKCDIDTILNSVIIS